MCTKKSIFIAILFLFYTVSAQAYDERYRSYGPETLFGKSLGWRAGGAGYTPGSDIITVGKLDGNDVGIFADVKENEDAIFRRWAMLREKAPGTAKYNTKGRLEGPPNERFLDELLQSFIPTEWSESYSEAVYRTYIRTISGQSSPYYYMQDALSAQIEAERNIVRNWLESKIAELDLASSTTAPVIHVEVANEPNVFPVIPPRLYAWYYLSYRKLVRNHIASINQDRVRNGKIPAVVKMMPAGLWIFSGFPNGFTNWIDKGISATVAGVTIDARMYPNAGAYLSEFLQYLRQPQYIRGAPAKATTLNGRIYNVTEFTFENAGNLSNVTYMYYDLQGRSVGTSLEGVAAGRYFKVPYRWDAAPIEELIDIGNLHFYPYIGVRSSQSLQGQLATLKNLSVQYASVVKDKQIWLTEIGNISSLDESKVTENLMQPMFTNISTQMPSITRWYWFKNRGNDSKFSMLNSVPTTNSDFAAWFFGFIVSETSNSLILSSIPGFHVSRLPDARTLVEMNDIADSWKDNPPLQGLKDTDGKLQKIGRKYASLSKAGSTVNPAINLLLLTD